MANSIVFQNSAEQLKSAVFGFNSSSNSYKAIAVNSQGQVEIVGTLSGIGTISAIGTIGDLSSITNGTVKVASGNLGTVAKLTSITNGTVKIASGNLGTVSLLTSITNGTIKIASSNLGTISELTSITNGTVKVASGSLGTVSLLSSITNGTVKIASGLLGTVAKLSSITNGTVKVASGLLGTVSLLSSITDGTIKVSNTVNINIADRIFTATIQDYSIAANSSVNSTLIDISKYQETSWYLQNTSGTPTVVTVQLAATPSSNLGLFPLALIAETATINLNPVVITNDYYLKYISAHFTNTTAAAQTVQLVFNGRY